MLVVAETTAGAGAAADVTTGVGIDVDPATTDGVGFALDVTVGVGIVVIASTTTGVTVASPETVAACATMNECRPPCALGRRGTP
jgi:hypothetical protein